MTPSKAANRYLVGATLAITLVIASFFIPLGSYTPTNSVCAQADPPVQRLHLILGQTLRQVEESDVQLPPSVGCSRQVKYVLYLL